MKNSVTETYQPQDVSTIGIASVTLLRNASSGVFKFIHNSTSVEEESAFLNKNFDLIPKGFQFYGVFKDMIETLDEIEKIQLKAVAKYEVSKMKLNPETQHLYDE